MVHPDLAKICVTPNNLKTCILSLVIIATRLALARAMAVRHNPHAIEHPKISIYSDVFFLTLKPNFSYTPLHKKQVLNLRFPLST